MVDIRVDEKVKTAMNEINAAKRLREVSLIDCKRREVAVFCFSFLLIHLHLFCPYDNFGMFSTRSLSKD